jgi:hypothetical protein
VSRTVGTGGAAAGSDTSASGSEPAFAGRHAPATGTDATAAGRAAAAAAVWCADAPGLRRRGTASRCGGSTRVHEEPLVVTPAFAGLHARYLAPGRRIDADGCLAALADDAVQPAATPPRSGEEACALGRPEGDGRLWRAAGRGRLAAAAAARRTRRRIDAGEEQLELAVRRHRILVLLAEKALVDEHVDIRRPGAGAVTALPETDGADVLLAAENQLRFLLSLRLMTPRGEDSAHEDGHDGERHEQGRHGVAPLPLLTP